MPDTLKVETDELSQLSRDMDRCYRNVCSNYIRDINSIKREMESIISRYSDYGSIVSSARGILSSLKDIEYKTGSIEEHSQRLVTNTKQAVALYKESEYMSKGVLDKGRLSFGKPIKSSGSIGSSNISFKASNELGEKSQEWEEELRIIGGNQTEKFERSESDIAYLEGGILYESIDGKIYKNGELVVEKDYKYIPHEVGGSRVTDGNGTFAKAYVENKAVYEQIGKQIYKNGVLVPEENYKYVPIEIGGIRDTIGRGSYVIVSQTYVEGDTIYQRIGGIIYKNGKEIAVDDYKYIPVEIGGIREVEGNGDFAQGYKEGEHTYIRIGDIIYKNGKEVSKNDYKYVPQEIGGLRKSVGNGSYITNGLVEMIKNNSKNIERETQNIEKDTSLSYWEIPQEVRNRLPSQCAFIDRIMPYVEKVHKETGIPWQFLIAQVCLESGYKEMVDMNTGEKSNNLFGIKFRESIHGVGNYIEVWTKEYVSASELVEWKKKHPELKELGKENGKYKIQVVEKFAKFNSLDQAFEKYKETLLNNNFKHALRNADDIEKYLLDIQSKLPGETHATYATRPDYVNLILSVMKTYHIPTKVEEVPSVSVPTSSEKETPTSNNNNSTGSNYLSYTIKSGDNLSDIARIYNTTVEELARLNGISNANVISIGKTLKIPQHTVGGNNTSSEMIEDSKPQVQTNQSANIPKNAWVPVTPAVTNSIGKRSAEAYNAVIDQFNVTTHPRYTPGKYTYCNIFAWDVMSAMGVELPQRVDSQTNTPRLFPDVKGTTELNANGMAKWLENYGTQYGWVEVSAKEAQQAANRGEPTVTAWNNPGGIGHFQVVRPTRGNDTFSYNTGVYVAQAGGSNFDYKTAASVYGQGKAMDKIKYYTHK